MGRAPGRGSLWVLVTGQGLLKDGAKNLQKSGET
jgi:hypothetical protein